jgi:phospholipase/carboxylesterase
VLTIQIGRLSRDALLQQGFAVEWKEYDMQHQVCAAEIADIAQWLQRLLA